MNTTVPDFSRYCLGTVFFRSNDFLENDFWECSSYFSRGDDICTVLKKFLYFIFNVVLFVNEMVVSRRTFGKSYSRGNRKFWKGEILEAKVWTFRISEVILENQSSAGKSGFREPQILKNPNFPIVGLKFWEDRILENPCFENRKFKKNQIFR